LGIRIKYHDFCFELCLPLLVNAASPLHFHSSPVKQLEILNYAELGGTYKAQPLLGRGSFPQIGRVVIPSATVDSEPFPRKEFSQDERMVHDVPQSRLPDRVEILKILAVKNRRFRTNHKNDEAKRQVPSKPPSQ
jgi:hypothetical protein